MAHLVEGSPHRDRTEPERENIPSGAAGETTLQAEVLMSSARTAAPRERSVSVQGGAEGPHREAAKGHRCSGHPHGRRGPPPDGGSATFWRRLLAST